MLWRFIPAALLLCVALSVVGCGGVDKTAVKPENPVPPPTQPPARTAETTTSTKLP